MSRVSYVSGYWYFYLSSLGIRPEGKIRLKFVKGPVIKVRIGIRARVQARAVRPRIMTCLSRKEVHATGRGSTKFL